MTGKSLLSWLSLGSAWILATPLAQAQETVDYRTVFDQAPWVSARAAGMSEAIDPIANGMEAPYYNPAAIGGLHERSGQPIVTQLYFPYGGAALNRSSQNLNKQLQSGANLQSDAVADELLQNYNGEHPYARLSLVPAITFSRFFLAYTYDVRASSAPNPETPGALDVSYREHSGPMLGFSYVTPKRDWRLGASGAFITRKIVEGVMPLEAVNDQDERHKAFRELQRKYQGRPANVALVWTPSAKWVPAASIVARHVSGTPFTPNEAETPKSRDREDVALGFSLSPSLGSTGQLNLVLQASELTRRKVPSREKLRFGSEITFGDAFGAEAGLSVRLGYRYVGPSFGLGANLGIIGLQFATFAENIGTNGAIVKEQRTVLNLGINIAAY